MVAPATKSNTEPLFPLGRLVATPGAIETIAASGEGVEPYLDRHITGDWSEMDDEDRIANRRSIDDGTRIFSAYKIKAGDRIWIITEADRSSTTVLLPEEY